MSVEPGGPYLVLIARGVRGAEYRRKEVRPLRPLRVTELLELGRQLDRRIARLRARPVGKAGEKVELAGLCHEFLARTRDFVGSTILDDRGFGLTLGQLQELLELVCRIGRVYKSGLFEI